MIFKFDLPSKECSPNWRGHWAKRAAVVKAHRWNARLVALSKISKLKYWNPIKQAHLHVAFIVPDNRRRDQDNLLARMKCVWDGMVDAGVFVDDNRLSFATTVEVAPKTTCVIVEVVPFT